MESTEGVVPDVLKAPAPLSVSSFQAQLPPLPKQRTDPRVARLVSPVRASGVTTAGIESPQVIEALEAQLPPYEAVDTWRIDDSVADEAALYEIDYIHDSVPPTVDEPNAIAIDGSIVSSVQPHSTARRHSANEIHLPVSQRLRKCISMWR